MIGYTNKILSYLDTLFPNPKTELIYNKDYEFLLAVMLSAQTTDKLVNRVTSILFSKYTSIKEFEKANIEDLENILKPMGTFRVKAKNIKGIIEKIKEFNCVPNNYEFLVSLPGVGRKTANLVLSNLYNEPYLAVDTHIIRVSNRLGLSTSNNPLVVEKDLYDIFKTKNMYRLHNQLVLFGRYYCKAKNPVCDTCKLKDICKKKEN